MFLLKRIYKPYAKSDGFRILVDRLWPRGVSKEKAKLNVWMKDIGPSNELRKWFSHDEKKWVEFEKRYKQELKGKKEMLAQLKDFSRKHKTITFLFGAKDEEHNEAIVLVEFLKK